MSTFDPQVIELSISMSEYERAKFEIFEIDAEIAHLEALLELRNEQRRELVNYLGLNKDNPKL